MTMQMNRQIEEGKYEPEELGPEDQFKKDLDFSQAYVSVYYLINVLFVMLSTTFMKRFFARPRPVRPNYEDEQTRNRRSFDMRTAETNCSFPSGDAAQAALFSFILMNNFKRTFMILGGPLGISQFVMAVCFARVYFHCHYLFDVLFGMFVGIFIASMLVRFGLRELLKSLFYNYLQAVITGGSAGGEFGEDYYDDM